MAKEKILVVDDEEDLLELIKFNLFRKGYKVVCTPSGEKALRTAKSEKSWIISSTMRIACPEPLPFPSAFDG